MSLGKVIFHIDVNSAFLSWEAVYRLHHLGWKGDLREQVSAVGGDMAMRHGIILAKSIPAKKYRIQTGESILEAKQKCPNLILVPPNYGLYERCSKAFMGILQEYSPAVEQYSIDEAFVDMTGTELLWGTPVEAAEKMRRQIKERLGFTVNIGISENKLLAKMASDFQKPDRVHTLWKSEIRNKMWPLPVSDLFFVGRATTKTLFKLGIRTIGDLAKSNPGYLKQHLKKHGEVIWGFANGIDVSVVQSAPPANKGYGNCLIVGLGVITTMLTYCFNIYKTKVQSQLVFKTMNEIIRCVQYSDYSESSKFNPSYLHQKINIDANKIWSFVFDNIISSVFQSLTIIGVIIAIGKINKKIFLLIMFIVPAYILSYYYLKKPLYEQSTRYKEEQSAYYKHINEQFEFIKKIKLWADYKNKENKRRREFGKYLEEFMKYTKLSYFYNSLESIITLVFKSTALIVGGIEMISGNLTLGEFLIISSYFGMLIQSIKFFFSFGQVYQDAKNSFDWITKIKNLEKEQYGTKVHGK